MSLVHVEINGVTCEVAPNHLKSAINGVSFPVSFLDCEYSDFGGRNFKFSLRTIRRIEKRPLESTFEEPLVPFKSIMKNGGCLHSSRQPPLYPSEMRKNANRLVADLPQDGSIVVWDREEQARMLQGLRWEYPDLAPILQGCIGRMVEMRPWFEKCIVWSPIMHKPSLETAMVHFFPEQPALGSHSNLQQNSFAMAKLFQITYQINKKMIDKQAIDIESLEHKAHRSMALANKLVVEEGKEQKAVKLANNACVIYGILADVDEGGYQVPLIDTLLQCASVEFMAFEPEKVEGHCQQAIDLCEKREWKDPLDVAERLKKAYYSLSVAAMMQRDYEREIDALTHLTQYCKQLMKEDNDIYSQEYLEALYRLAFCHYNRGQYEQAEAEYVELADLVERVHLDYMCEPMGMKAKVYEDWGRLHRIQNHLDEAHKLFDIAIDVYNQIGFEGRELASVMEVKARCYFAQGYSDKALQQIDNAIAQDPDNADWYDTKGYFLLQQERVGEAKQLWQKVLELEPNHLDYGYSDLYELLKERDLI